MKKQPKMKDKMRQRSLAVDERSLFEKLCDQVNLRAGFKAVRKNGGSPGIDGVTVDQFSNRIDEELAQLKKNLEGWSDKVLSFSSENRLPILRILTDRGTEY